MTYAQVSFVPKLLALVPSNLTTTKVHVGTVLTGDCHQRRLSSGVLNKLVTDVYNELIYAQI